MIDRSEIETVGEAQTNAKSLVANTHPLSAEPPSAKAASLWVEALTVSPDASVTEVVQQMAQTRNCCVVVMQERRPIGIFTERDLVKLLAQKRSLTQLAIAEVMTSQVNCISFDEVHHTWEVFQRMQQHRVRHLPVIDWSGELVGVITGTSLRENIKATDLLKLRRVSEVMNPQVVHTSGDRSLYEVVQLMAQHKVSCVVITETNAIEDLIPIGIITERDIVRLQNQRIELKATPVYQMMTSPLIFIHEKDTLMQVYELMKQHQIRRMVIQGDRGQLTGIITQSSILHAIDPLETYVLVQILQQQVEQLQEENLVLLEQSKRALEQQVQERIAQQLEKDRYDRLLTTTALYIRQSLDLKEILTTTVTELRRILACDRTLVFQFTADSHIYVVSESVTSPALSMAGKCIADPRFQQHSADIYQGKAHAIDDVLNCSHATEPYLQALAEYQVRASLIVPILQGDRLWGLLVSHQCDAPRHWRASETEFITQLATHVSIAIQQAMLVEQLQAELAERQQAEAALQQLNTELEQRVAERTAALTVSNAKLQTELAERARTEKALQESEARYRRIVETANEGIWVIDAENKTTFANPKMAEMLACSVEEMQGESPFRFMSGEERAIAQRMLELRSQGIFQEHDFKLQRKDGTNLWVLISATPIFDAEGQYLGALAMVVDITERHRLEQMKTEFISMVSHELRTPLTAIYGFLGLLNTGSYDNQPEKAKRMIRQALINSERLTRLVNDILDLERLSSGQVHLVKQSCNVEDLMQGAVAGLQPLAEEAAINLKIISTPIQAEVAPDALIQTLTNLLSNAIKFSPAHSTVTLSVQIQNNTVLFSVKDEGRGIPTDKLELIFDRFQQVDASDSREKSGTGLGLAICRRIVEEHGGNIWVKSLVGKGSIFYFTIPISN